MIYLWQYDTVHVSPPPPCIVLWIKAFVFGISGYFELFFGNPIIIHLANRLQLFLLNKVKCTNCGLLTVRVTPIYNLEMTLILLCLHIKWSPSNDGYFVEGLNILINTFCVCPGGFQDLSKAFHFPVPCTIINFFCSLKILTNFDYALTHSSEIFSVIGRCSLVLTSHWLQEKCAWINLSQAASRYDFTKSQAASWKNRRCRVFEAGH